MSDPKERSAPVSPYDYLTETIVRRIDREIKQRVGKETMRVQDHTITSIFTYSSGGAICGACGSLQTVNDASACEVCGAAYRVSLIVGS